MMMVMMMLNDWTDVISATVGFTSSIEFSIYRRYIVNLQQFCRVLWIVFNVDLAVDKIPIDT